MGLGEREKARLRAGLLYLGSILIIADQDRKSAKLEREKVACFV